MLIGNYSVLNKNPGRAFGGSTVSDTRYQYGKSGPARGAFVGSLAEYSSIPNGSVPPYSWVIPLTGGGMAIYMGIFGTGVLSSVNLAGGLNAESVLSGTGSSTADIAALGHCIAALTAIGSLSADTNALGNFSSLVLASSTVSGDLGAIYGMLATLAGSVSTSFDIGALGVLGGLLSGSSTQSATLDAVGEISTTTSGSSTVSANLASVLLAYASISSSGTVSASLGALFGAEAILSGTSAISAIIAAALETSATLSGSGVIVSAAVMSLLEAAASISGSSTHSADISATGNIISALSGSSSFTGAVTALAILAQTLNGSGSVVEADLRALASLTATITPFTELSPQSLAAFLWNSVADEYNESGTFGERLNFLYVLSNYKVVTDPSSGTMTIYDTDGTTVLHVADLFEDADGIQPYQGQGAEFRDKFS